MGGGVVGDVIGGGGVVTFSGVLSMVVLLGVVLGSFVVPGVEKKN